MNNYLFDRLSHHQQTLKELKQVIHCVEVNQREFVETIDVCCDYLTGDRKVFGQDLCSLLTSHLKSEFRHYS